MIVAALDWTAVTVASIAALGSIASAVLSAYVLGQLRTGNGKTVGQAVTETHKDAKVTNAIVRRRLGQREKDAQPPAHDPVTPKRSGDA